MGIAVLRLILPVLTVLPILSILRGILIVLGILAILAHRLVTTSTLRWVLISTGALRRGIAPSTGRHLTVALWWHCRRSLPSVATVPPPSRAGCAHR